MTLQIKAATFNCQTQHSLRISTPQNQNPLSLDERMRKLAVNISLNQLDFVMLQEFDSQAAKALRKSLGRSYLIIQFDHLKNNRSIGDGLGVVIDPDKFHFSAECLTIQTMDGHGNQKQLQVPVVKVTDRTSNRQFTILSTHISGGPNRDIGKSEIQTLLGKVERCALPIFIGTDMNADSTDERHHQFLYAGFHHIDENNLSIITEPGRNRQIDYIKFKLAPGEKLELIRTSIDPVENCSDHHMLIHEFSVSPNYQRQPVRVQNGPTSTTKTVRINTTEHQKSSKSEEKESKPESTIFGKFTQFMSWLFSPLTFIGNLIKNCFEKVFSKAKA